jgi:hypothetical protein
MKQEATGQGRSISKLQIFIVLTVFDALIEILSLVTNRSISKFIHTILVLDIHHNYISNTDL